MHESKITPTADITSPTGFYIPIDIDDCIRELNAMLPTDFKEKIQASSESDLSQYHLGLGTWLRNNWGLWMEISHLRQYFINLGITNADDMTSIILTSFWEKLNGKPINVPRQIVYNKISKFEIQSGAKPGN